MEQEIKKKISKKFHKNWHITVHFIGETKPSQNKLFDFLFISSQSSTSWLGSLPVIFSKDS